MSTRSTWKGSVKIGLVQIPARLYAAGEPKSKSGISFHRYHGVKPDGTECLSRTKSKAMCPVCNIELSRGEDGDTVRGYEVKAGERPVVVTDEELSALSDEASSVMSITSILNEAIDPLYVDGTMLLVAEAGAKEAFETFRVALKDRLLIGQVVLKDKATRVALEAREDGFLVYKLRANDQVRSFTDLDMSPSVSVTPAKADLQLANQLLENLDDSFTYEDVRDDHTARVRAFLEAKAAGKPIPLMAAPKANVQSLSTALAESLRLMQATKAAAKLPAKAKAAKAQPAMTQKRKRA